MNNPSHSKEEGPGLRKETAESIVEEEVPANEEEDYNEDDFEQESQKSGTKNFQGTLSQSGLPPLASGKFNTQNKIVVDDTTSDNGIKGNPSAPPLQQSRTNRLPTDFNLNIAESANSIDFDVSDSKGNFLSQMSLQTAGGHNQSNAKIEMVPGQRRSTYIDNLNKKRLDEEDAS